MHEKRFEGAIERLRAPERVARLEVERVVSLSLAEADLKSVLEVGVGSGLFAEVFDRRGLKVAGVDANAEMITAAQGYVPRGEFREAVAEALPYPDASFDLVFFGLVLHEADEPLKALQEARRITRQRVCILEWPYPEGEFGPPLAHRLSPEEIENLARQAGFTQVESIQLDYLVFYRLTV
jgi:ubiquinone/menaquinone biosynthesis C-methylase UbiE